jgi:5-formyltetrahydrofolate cyclo-ligase
MKADIRVSMKHLRSSFKADDLSADSLAIQDRLCAMDEFARARRVGCYLSTVGEVGTGRIISTCQQAGKEVAVPARRGAPHEYGLCWFNSGAPLLNGQLGILEPSAPDWVEAAELDLIVVPGVAFDAACRRLGHGLGCYDRMLAGAVRPFKVGLAFEWQMVDEVPTDETDVPMDAVVTERMIYRLGTGGETQPCRELFSRTQTHEKGKGSRR